MIFHTIKWCGYALCMVMIRVLAKQGLESFLTTFVLPLVTGGQCEVSDPFDLADAQQFSQALPHCSFETEAIDKARRQVLAKVVCNPNPFLFSENDLRLSMAVHNFLVLVHPRISISLKKKKMLIGTVKKWIFAETKFDAGVLQSRHGLLHGLLQLHRRDQVLTWWTGKARFLGEEPPARLLRWGRIRRVSSDVSEQPIFGLLDEELLALYSLILTRTPLTLLLSTDEHPLAYSWRHLLPVLFDKALSRAVVQEYSKRDGKVMHIPKRHGYAFQQLLVSEKDPSCVPVVCQFLSMVLLSRLDYLKNTNPKEWKFEKDAIADVIEKNDDLKMIYGLPLAMKELKSQASIDWKHIGNNDDHAIQDFYLDTLEEVLDPDSVQQMSSALDRALSAVVI